MSHTRIIEFGFFYGILLISGYLVFKMLAPFLTALALAAVIVVVCMPLHRQVLRRITRSRATIAALISTFFVYTLIVLPLVLVSRVLVEQFLSLYYALDGTSLSSMKFIEQLESMVQVYIPSFTIDVAEQAGQALKFVTENAGVLFSNTISATMTFLLSILCTFYLFKDGHRFIEWLINVSPLSDSDDIRILEKVAVAVRSTVTGTILISIIQGATASIGFAIFGISQPILWGSIGALGALLPGVGTSAIMLPAVVYLFFTSTPTYAIGLTIWAVLSIIIIDNIVSPHLLGRSNDLHPLTVLLSVLGGVALFGPLGFILGPVVVTLFLVLIQMLTLYKKPGVVFNKRRST